MLILLGCWCPWPFRSQGKAEARREPAMAAAEDDIDCFKLLGPKLGKVEEQLFSFLSITGQNFKMILH